MTNYKIILVYNFCQNNRIKQEIKDLIRFFLIYYKFNLLNNFLAIK